jgi:hypothetical protein
MYAIILNELKAVLKTSAREVQSGVVNRTSVESTSQDEDFHEVKRSKRHISNNTSQTVEKSNKPVPISAAAKLPPKALLTRNFFAPVRNADMDTECICAENTYGAGRFRKTR